MSATAETAAGAAVSAVPGAPSSPQSSPAGGGASRPVFAPGPQDPVNTDVAVRRKAEARLATLALGTAAVLSIIRATVLPLLLAAAPAEQFASFVSPNVRLANWLLAGVFVAACLWAPRQPLYASLAALALYLVYAIPDILHNPVLIGGGHIGKIVTLGILARAAFAGVMHRLLQYERAS